MQIILETTLFLLAIFSCFYLPGKLLAARLKLKLNSVENSFFPLSIGLAVFTLIAYVFCWLKLRMLIPVFILLLDLAALKSKKWLPKKIDKKHLKPFLIIVSLAIIFSLSMVVTGVYGNGISLRRDDLWHLALINELKAHFPPDNPGFAGIPLRGYHYFYNFLLAEISRVFRLSPLSLYFHYFPLLTAFLWGLGVYSLMMLWSKKQSVSLWAVFMTFFGGSLAFILRLRGHMGLSLDDAFGITQPSSSLVNPPFAISIVIIITGLFSLYQYLNARKNNWLIPLILCGGMITMFKVYAGMIFLGGLAILVLIEALQKKWTLLAALAAMGFIFLGTYWILADHSASLIFQPLWPPRKMLLDNLTWYGYEEKRYTYSRLSVVRGLIKIELYGLFVFIIGSLGTRVLGLLTGSLSWLKKRKLPSLFSLTIFMMLLISILTPLFFIQTGKVFEMIQMAWYFLFFSSLLASFGLADLFSFQKNRFFKFLFLAIFLLATLPSAWEKYSGYFKLAKSRTSLSSPYFEAMRFLESQGAYDATVLEIPSEYINPSKEDIRKWYRGSSPAIVGFANKRAYFNSEFIDFTNLDVDIRINFLEKILLCNNTAEVKNELLENKISFIYSPYPLSCFETIKEIQPIYQNQKITIYQVYEN